MTLADVETGEVLAPGWPAGVHPAAELFPMLDADDLRALADDIKANGLRDPLVVLPDGRLLDGRNRAAACGMADVTPATKVYDGPDPVAFVVSSNVHRRHLTTGQKAMLALDVLPLYEEQAKERQRAAGPESVAKREGWTVGADRPQPSRTEKSTEQAARATGTSGKSVARAKRVAEKRPDLAEQVKAGSLSLDAAEKAVKREERQEEAARRHDEIKATPTADLQKIGRYRVLYVDPPWRYEHAEPTRKIENHYPTMSPAELAALDVPAAEDAVLFMWATSPKLSEALDLIRAWGFDYRTSLVWVKPSIGMGYYARQRHELLLVAKRGNPGTPAETDRPDSVIEAPKGKHSEKPAEVYDLIDRMYPGVAKVEMFARCERPGWVGWGNQA